MSVQPDNIPDGLTGLDQWVLWRLETRGKGKATKVPYSAHGGPGKTNDASTWSSFVHATSELDRGDFSGVGFCLAPGDGLVGIDLDKCMDEDGKISPAAAEIIERFRHVAYVEISPSGKGFRLFCLGKAQRSGKGNGPDKWIEVYDHESPRYLTVTGHLLYGQKTRPQDAQCHLDWLHDKYLHKAPVEPVRRVATRPSDLSDRDLLERIERSTQGHDFQRLYNGDAGTDHSSADLSLCNILAFWCGRDEGQMDRIFRGSGLMRDKWDRTTGEGGLYGERTIRLAVDGCREVYTPPTQQQAHTPNPVAGVLDAVAADGPDDYALCTGSSDEGNAQILYLLYGSQFLYCDAYGWLHWCGTHWERDGALARLERHTISALQCRRAAAVVIKNEAIIKSAKPSATNVRSCMFLFRSLVVASVDSFDADEDLLNVNNGTIHLPTGELRRHNRDERQTYCIEIDLRLDADDSAWLEFLRGVVTGEGDENEEVVKYLQRCAGYSLTGHTSEEVLWYIHGPSRSGKGTFSETLLSILGSPLSTEVDFSTFTRDRDNDASNFDLAPLKPARMVFASESERHQRMNGAKVKALTGGNKIQCCFKHKDHFSYRPQYKIWLTSNYPPNADVDDDAVWGRLRVLVFPRSHLGTEDKGLKAKMRERKSLEGVLAWAVRGAGLWYDDRDSGLETPEHVKTETKRARVELDMVGQWVEECVEKLEDDTEICIPNSDLYKNYTNWCEENGVTPKQKRSLTQALNNKGFEGPKVKKIMRKTSRVWPGMQFV